MKTFKVRPDSWHYKFLTKTGDSHYDIKYGCKDFCTYWRKVFFRCVVTLVVVSLITILAGLYISGLIFHTTDVLIGTGLVVAAFVLIFGGAFTIETMRRKMQERALENADKPDGLIKTKYKSFKQKYCPMVEVVEND